MDKLEHELIPKHTKLSDDEKTKVLEQYHVTVHGLPKISINDPAIAHLDVKSGDVVKIERSSRTAGEAVYFRGVINE